MKAILITLGLLLLVTACADQITGEAITQSNIAQFQGYAPPVDQAGKPILTVDQLPLSPGATEVSYKVRVIRPGGWIWPEIYYSKADKWVRKSLGSDWISGSAEGVITYTIAEMDDEEFVAAYTCVPEGPSTARRFVCGCEDPDDAECRSYHLQSFEKPDTLQASKTDILVGAWFYDGWHSISTEISAECEEKTNHFDWLFDAKPREVDFVYSREQTQSPLDLGYEYRGVVAYLPREGTPLYRLRHNGHRYTVNETEKDILVAQGAVLEGTLGFVGPKAPGTKRLFRLRYMGGVEELTTDEQRAWRMTEANVTRINDSVLGFVFDAPGQGRTELHGYARPQPGEVLPRTPMLGRATSDDPASMAQHIAWADEHAIDFFAFEWFYMPNPVCDVPLRKYKALHEFLENPQNNRMKFIVGWFTPDTSHPFLTSEADYEQGFAYALEQYFSHPSYLKLEGKPVIYFAFSRPFQQFGATGVNRIIATARQQAQAAGFPDIFIVGIGASTPNQNFASLELDGFTRFTYNNEIEGWTQTASLIEKPSVISFEQYAQAYEDQLVPDRDAVRTYLSDAQFIPTVGAGWDRTIVPWLKYRSHIAIDNDPAIFRDQLEHARSFLLAEQDRPGILMITAWNEWSEGQIIEPDNIHGTAYLEQVASVFDTEPQHYHVYIAAGQSNMEGFARGADLESDPIDDAVRFSFMEKPNMPSQDPTYGSWGALRPQVSATSHFGPEIYFGRLMAAQSQGPIAIIKYSQGSTNLAHDWAKGDTTGKRLYDGNSQFDGFIEFVHDRLAELEAQGHTYQIDGMIWMQGESDVPAEYNAQYAANLEQFISDVRADIADMPIVIGRIHHRGTPPNGVPNVATVRDAQVAVADAHGDVDWVDTDSFSIFTQNNHFDNAGQRDLGTAMAQKMLALT